MTDKREPDREDDESRPSKIVVRKEHVATVLDEIKCPWSDIVDHLRDLLNQLKYSTRQCKACRWVDHEDTITWCECRVCDLSLCEECVAADCYKCTVKSVSSVCPEVIICSECKEMEDEED